MTSGLVQAAARPATGEQVLHMGGAVMVGKCRSRGARRLKNIASDSLSIVSEMNAIMWALGGRSLATHIQDKRAANK